MTMKVTKAEAAFEMIFHFFGKHGISLTKLV